LRIRQVHLARQVLHAVIGLGDGGGAEGVGFDDVGAGGEVTLVDVGDHVGAGQAQQLVVALDVVGKVLEPLATVLLLRSA
jgi:hypothetical protein